MGRVIQSFSYPMSIFQRLNGKLLVIKIVLPTSWATIEPLTLSVLSNGEVFK